MQIENLHPESITFCERFLELMIDLMSQLITRRFLHLLLEDMHFVILSRRPALSKLDPEGVYKKTNKVYSDFFRLFNQLLGILRFYQDFEIDNFKATALTDDEMVRTHYAKIKKLQRVAFKDFPELKRFSLTNIGIIDFFDFFSDL